MQTGRAQLCRFLPTPREHDAGMFIRIVLEQTDDYKRNPLVSIHVSRLTASYISQRCVLKGDFGLFATLYALRRPGFTGRLISWDGVVDSRSSYRALWLDIFHQYHKFYPEESTLKV